MQIVCLQTTTRDSSAATTAAAAVAAEKTTSAPLSLDSRISFSVIERLSE